MTRPSPMPRPWRERRAATWEGSEQAAGGEAARLAESAISHLGAMEAAATSHGQTIGEALTTQAGQREAAFQATATAAGGALAAQAQAAEGQLAAGPAAAAGPAGTSPTSAAAAGPSEDSAAGAATAGGPAPSPAQIGQADPAVLLSAVRGALEGGAIPGLPGGERPAGAADMGASPTIGELLARPSATETPDVQMPAGGATVATGPAGAAAGPGEPGNPLSGLVSLAGAIDQVAGGGPGQAEAGGPLAALIADLQAGAARGATAAEAPAERPAARADEAATTLAQGAGPAAAQIAGSDPERTATLEPAPAPATYGPGSAPSAIPGTTTTPPPGYISEWIPGPGQHLGQPVSEAHGPGPGEHAASEDRTLPVGKDQRQRQQEREFVRAVQRRMLEERERMGGLGGLIR